MFIPFLIKEFQEAKTYHYDLTDSPIITAFDLEDKIKLADKLFYFCSATSVFKWVQLVPLEGTGTKTKCKAVT